MLRYTGLATSPELHALISLLQPVQLLKEKRDAARTCYTDQLKRQLAQATINRRSWQLEALYTRGIKAQRIDTGGKRSEQPPNYSHPKHSTDQKCSRVDAARTGLYSQKRAPKRYSATVESPRLMNRLLIYFHLHLNIHMHMYLTSLDLSA